MIINGPQVVSNRIRILSSPVVYISILDFAIPSKKRASVTANDSAKDDAMADTKHDTTATTATTDSAVRSADPTSIQPQFQPASALSARVMPIPYMSVERLKPYLAATNGHQKDSLTLYRWNVAMSGAVYQALHYFEVVLRNAMDEQLSAWNATQTSALGSRLNAAWAREPAAVLDRIAGKDIDTAYDRAQKELDIKHGSGVRTPTHDDVIAQSSFGLWRFLLPSSSDPGKQMLWKKCLHKAFPHRIRPEAQLSAAVHGVYLLRNRVAHLEPLRFGNVQAQYRNMVTVTGDIDPDLQNWFTSVTQAVPNGLKARPDFTRR